MAKVGDFGLARHVDPRLHEGLPTWQWYAYRGSPQFSKLADVSDLDGAIHRLAPEILDHENTEYDERSDIYRCRLHRLFLLLR